LLRSSTPTDAVAAGQLRQAYWKDVNAVVLIESIDDANATALVLPASLEAGVVDSGATVLEESASPLHGPIALWPQRTMTLPFAVLGDLLATIPAGQLALLRTSGGVTGAAGVRVGYSDPPLDSGAALAVDELFDALDTLQSGPRLEKSGVRAAVSLQIPLPVIMAALHIPQPRAMAVRMGKEPLTLEEAGRLAEAANLQPEEVLAALASLPDDLERELQEPRWRPAVRQRAHDGDEAHARMRLGYEAYQLAARESGDGRERWRQRLTAVLAATAK
jgi:hypothetical protein